jgi:hypothetical protein
VTTAAIQRPWGHTSTRWSPRESGQEALTSSPSSDPIPKRKTTTSSFSDGIGSSGEDSPDFSPLNFSQRFAGIFSDDGKTISGAWEICHDATTWEHDFDLIYTKVSQPAE